MANCNNLFYEYNKVIRLSDPKRVELLRARESLRQRMREGYGIVSRQFSHQHLVDFQSQGSFVMDTIITPMHDDYDLDDGVYFLGKLKAHERPEPKEFHSWVIRAIDRGFDDIEKITDKDTCVRVEYKDKFHIDLPIYYADNFEAPELADKGKGWILSHPVEFIVWFEDKIKSGFQKAFLLEARMYPQYEKWLTDIRKADHQLRRIVRYLKSWGDLRREEMPCGLIMTILAANHYYPHDRDDISLKETIINIHAELTKPDGFKCERPTIPKGEDLFQAYKNKDAFLKYLKYFIDNAKKGLEEPNEKTACEYWQNSLGNRFPCQLAKNEINVNSGTAGLVAGGAGHKPYARN